MCQCSSELHVISTAEAEAARALADCVNALPSSTSFLPGRRDRLIMEKIVSMLFRAPRHFYKKGKSVSCTPIYACQCSSELHVISTVIQSSSKRNFKTVSMLFRAPRHFYSTGDYSQISSEGVCQCSSELHVISTRSV